jgi:hypothetical protein
MTEERATDDGVNDPNPAVDEHITPEPEHPQPQPHDETALLRDLIARAHPDVVPELIHGTSLHEMLASLPEAQAVYARILAASRESIPTQVPAGSGVRTPPLDAGSLSAMAKIKAGLRN